MYTAPKILASLDVAVVMSETFGAVTSQPGTI